jgi:dipeptidyl aminopeptidase/acylaminoacyl peptidase
LIIASLLFVATCSIAAIYYAHLSRVQREYFVNRRGEVVNVDFLESATRADGGMTSAIRLRSSSGLQVDMRLLLPPTAKNNKVPLMLLIGGHRTGKAAIDLIGDSKGIAFAAIDYPYHGPQSISGVWQAFKSIPTVQSALLDTPPSLMLAVDWLEGEAWFDRSRMELAGISLGVPFAAAAGALDQRFTRVWLIHGASDNNDWLMHASRDRIADHHVRKLAVDSLLKIAYGDSFNTVTWLQEISPRPVLVIAARDDERVPRHAMQYYVDANERGELTLEWTDGNHVDPGHQDLLTELVARVAAEMKSSK